MTLTTPGFALILNFTMLLKKLLLGIECPLHSLHQRVGTSWLTTAWMNSLTLGFTLLTQLFLLMLVQLHPLQLLHPTPFTLLHVQLLLVSVATSTLTLADPLVRDVSSTSLLSSGACMDSSDLATSIFGPLPSEALTFNLPQPDDERTLQEWCSSELVSLPSTALPASDGTVMPLNQKEREELSDHLRSGHSSKSNLCRGCLQAEGPRKVHRTVRDIDRATHTLHIDIAGPFTTSDDGYTYFLVGALRLPGFSSTHRCQIAYFSWFCRSLWCTWAHGCLLRIASKRRLYNHWLLKNQTSPQRSCWWIYCSINRAFSHQSQEHLPHFYLRLRPSGQWNCWAHSWTSQISCG